MDKSLILRIKFHVNDFPLGWSSNVLPTVACRGAAGLMRSSLGVAEQGDASGGRQNQTILDWKQVFVLNAFPDPGDQMSLQTSEENPEEDLKLLQSMRSASAVSHGAAERIITANQRRFASQAIQRRGRSHELFSIPGAP